MLARRVSLRPVPVSLNRPRNKSLFASFSSVKEESSFFEKKEAKKLLSSRWSRVTAPHRA
jgi:hypothetical protein